jgi:hypothetical protein
MRRGKTYTNKTKYRSVKYVIKEEEIQVFDRNLVKEMQKRPTRQVKKEEQRRLITSYLP